MYRTLSGTKTIYINLVSNYNVNSKVCSIPESCSEVEVDLKRLDRMLQAAHRSSIDIKDSYDFYVLALKEFNKENIPDSFLYCDRAKYELTSAINDAKIKIKGSRFHSLRTISYFFKLYGLYAVIFAMLSVLFFSLMIQRILRSDHPRSSPRAPPSSRAWAPPPRS